MTEPTTHIPENERFLAWDPPTLDLAAEHGCLDESIETGDPLVCARCLNFGGAA